MHNEVYHSNGLIKDETFHNYPGHVGVRVYMSEVVGNQYIVNLWSYRDGWANNKRFGTFAEADEYYEQLRGAAFLQALPDLWR